MVRASLSAFLVLFLACGSAGLRAQRSTTSSGPDPWWKHAVFYEIYPRSFQDSNDDGVGDLNGITMRLGYLEKLGIDAIWIAPCFPSPLVDFGYDVSDYDAIDPQFGTLADMDRLMHEAGKHHIRVLLDFVANHSSDQHPWFMASRSGKEDPKRDWYIWRDGRIGADGKIGPPNNWHSVFGGSAWTLDPTTNQYYYHRFYAQQPDLNWRNPAVEKAMFDQMRFWLDRGVAGFRLDSIDTLLEDPELGDEGYRHDPKGEIMRDRTGTAFTTSERTSNLPEIHDIIRRMRAMLGSYPGDRVLIGETYLPNVMELDKWYGGDARDELQLPMDTQVGIRNTLNPETWRTRLEEAETQLHGSMPLLVYDNHDNPRLDRYCRETQGADCGQIQRMLETILLTSRDAALLYYGDEIGMATGAVPAEPSRRRDAERTPMQWDRGKNAGFSQADKTWLPVLPDYATVNVEAERTASDSMLMFHRRLIALRRTDPVLREGDQQSVPFQNAHIVAYTRTAKNDRRLVITNFSGEEQEIEMREFVGRRYRTLESNFAKATDRGRFAATFKVPPYGAILLWLEPGGRSSSGADARSR